jgi:hypothetical protein
MFFNEIGLETSDPDILFHYYSDLLGLNTFVEKDRLIIIAGKTRLIFTKSVVDKKPFYHYAFNIPWNKFKEAFVWANERFTLQWLEDYNGYIAEFENWHARSFYFHDPVGNILEFIARADLNDNVDDDFSSNHIRNISEIGIVLNKWNFNEEVESMMRKFSISYFRKQPPLPYFRAMGNDEGLFIIVPEAREWFGASQKKAEIFSTWINFNNKGNSFILSLPG